ncbi:hypothetical protein [Lacticaseibacillus manihotivorans]|uniref:Transposase TnpC homeodomain domain-containing protein n=1 Tax=Lacticaseibacillus manihotivorans TaxID=88233 RepID=A0A5P8JRK2_9LACO|nr:hypothetical protein [Lacticaseibacillus manihotivorans]QFQ91875.1 hypothetical protein LM010_10765 [Lacticaseibacillus manihotivorans]
MSEIATVDEHEEVLALRRKVDELETQLEWFRKQVFGQKSEHAKPMDVNQLSLFAQLSRAVLKCRFGRADVFLDFQPQAALL